MTLDKLPTELMLLISRYPSPVDLSCLALCNHRFMTFSSAGSFKDLLGQAGTKGPSKKLCLDLLSRLARSLPQYYLCFACLRLHLWKYVELPSPHFKNRGCYYRLDTLSSPLGFRMFPTYSVYKFHFVHLYLAMRRHYFGPSFGISADSLLYIEVSRALLDSRNPNSHRRTGLMSIDARVCLNPSSLCPRIQNITVTKRQDLQPLFRSTSDKFDYRYRDNIAVCEHIDPTDTVKSLIGNYSRQGERGDRQFSNQGKCNQCNTSWNMELRELEEQDICFVFTQYKDLGPGLDPEDDRWKTHLFQNHPKTVRKRELLDDPRTRFEMLSERCSSPQAMSMEDMFRRNMALLKGRRYRAVMRYWGGWWYLQGEEGKTRYPQCNIV